MDAPLTKKEACILLGCGLTWFDKMVRQKSRLRLQDRPRVQFTQTDIIAMDWTQVDLGRRHVQFLNTKNGQSRSCPLHPVALAALANLPHGAGPVFRRPDGLPYARKADGGGQIKTGFGCACRRAGLSGVTPHTLRHTWASWHYQQHRDLRKLMDLGGWNSLAMVVRYSHVNADEHAELDQ